MGSGGGGNSLVIFHDELYVGGSGGVRRWTGSTWELPGGVMLFGVTQAMTVWNDRLVVGGYHYSWNHIAQWNGSAWTTVGTGVNDGIEDLTVYEGDLIAGGWFTAAGGGPASSIARWNGSSWSEFGGGLGNSVQNLEVSGNDLYVGGNFNSLTGDPNYIARWDGAAWRPLGSGLLGAPLALLADEATGKLWVGGNLLQSGGIPAVNAAQWTFGVAVAVAEAETPSLDFGVRARPNPFRAKASVSFTLPGHSRVRAEVYDVRGRIVSRLADGVFGGGEHTIEWDGRGYSSARVAPGVYLLRLEAGERTITRKLVLSR
jgi:hypothetical protein